MGATFSRLKNWISEALSSTDLNAEIDNILNNLGPAGVDDYSTNAAQMRLTSDPGESGSESLATSLAGEIERLRFALKEIKGSNVTYWYETPSTSLSDLSSAVGGGLPDNRIASGKSSANSSQLTALDPSGTTTSVTLLASSTNFIYYIGGTQYSATADVTVTGLSAGPSANATAAVNDAQAGDNQFSQLFGEHGTSLNISAAGSEFASKVGTFNAFALNNGSATEYLVGYLQSTSQITRAWRGCFFDGSQNPIPKVSFTNADSITLLRLAWIFATTTSSMAVTYTTPVYSHTEPSGPSSGDYWFDTSTSTWKRYNSTSWEAANATLIGMTAQSSAACVAARTFDKFTSVDDLSTLNLEWVSNSQIQTREGFNSVNVFGQLINYGMRPIVWDMASHLDSGLAEAASTYYYLYLKENGAPLISDKAPSDFRGSRRGYYHPSETWRCIGVVFNDASQNLIADTVYTFNNNDVTRVSPTQATGYRLTASVNASAMTVQLRDQIGNYPSKLVPTQIPIRNVTATVGSYASRILTTMPEITVGSASTLGHGNSRSCPIFAYLFDSGSSYDLGVTSAWKFGPGDLITSLAIGSTGTADSGTAMYTTAALTSKPAVLLGHLIAPQTSAGVWTAAPTTISVGAYFPEQEELHSSAGPANPHGDTRYVTMGGTNSLTLDPGEWELHGEFYISTTANVATEIRTKWAAADTTNPAGGEPADLSTLTGLTVIEGNASAMSHNYNANFSNIQVTHDIIVRTTQTNVVYFNLYTDNSGNGLNCTCWLWARRIRKIT